MLFPSVPFLFYFLPLLLIAYFLTPARIPLRNTVLLTASILFYTWGELPNLWVLALSIAFTYLIGLRVAGSRGWLAVGILGELSLLAIFKYTGFVLTNLEALGLPLALTPEQAPPLPLGISFFTFHALSYLIDVYRKKAPPARRLGDLALYILLFPQLIAGPIVRFSSLHRQIARRWVTLGRFRVGFELLLIGLLQKLVLADTIARPVDAIYALAPQDLSLGVAWMGAGLYMLQLYMDFSGYSHMAIGLAMMVGFRFPRNFNYPLQAVSITDFWRRWHISLSRWFRDYLYIPLGGNRTGMVRTSLNLSIVFLLCGLWHGASWNFVLWGLYNGGFLVIERLGLLRVLDALPRWLAQGYAVLVAVVGFVLFRAADLSQAGHFYATMAGFGATDAAASAGRFYTPSLGWAAALAALCLVPVARLIPRRSFAAPWLPWLRPPLAAAALAVIALLLAQGSYSPFLYFRF